MSDDGSAPGNSATENKGAAEGKGPGGVQSLHRALDVLEAFATAGGTASLSDIAAACGLPAPTVHRLAATLAGRGYLRQLPDRRYCLGSRLVPIGAQAHAQLGERAQPVLRGLAELTGESANLAVLTQDCAEYVSRALGTHTMRIFTEVGNRVALYCTGVGKAILAVLPPERAAALITAAPLAAHTPTTITDPDELRAEIAAIRERGYALDEGEMEVGVRCVAVGLPGAVPMAMSVSGPAARMTDDLVATAVCALRAASADLARHLA